MSNEWKTTNAIEQREAITIRRTARSDHSIAMSSKAPPAGEQRSQLAAWNMNEHLTTDSICKRDKSSLSLPPSLSSRSLFSFFFFARHNEERGDFLRCGASEQRCNGPSSHVKFTTRFRIRPWGRASIVRRSKQMERICLAASVLRRRAKKKKKERKKIYREKLGDRSVPEHALPIPF